MSAVFSLRRIVWLTAFAALGAAMLAWLRERTDTPTPAAAPQWPPFDPATAPSSESASASPATKASASSPATAESRTTAATTTSVAWQPPHEDGSCPDGYPVKVKDSSGIYHLPEGRFYERTHADRCYPDAAAAEADGYRQSKS